MALPSILQGIIIGFALAAPIGPIGILCIKRSLTDGMRGGFAVGLSGATADVVYALCAAFGVQLVVDFVSEQQVWIRLVGAFFLLAVGFHLVRNQPSSDSPRVPRGLQARSYLSTLLLALTNPLTLFAFMAAFSSIGVESMTDDAWSLVPLIIGVFIGSLSWFILLGSLARRLSGGVGARGAVLINRIAGALLMLFGIIGLFTVLRSF